MSDDDDFQKHTEKMKHLSKTDVNIIKDADYFGDIRDVSKENTQNNAPKLKFLTSIFANIRTYGKKTPGLGVMYKNLQTGNDKQLGFGFLRQKLDQSTNKYQSTDKYIREYLIAKKHERRRAFIAELYDNHIRYFAPHFDNILLLYGLPSTSLIEFLTVFGETMSVYEELFTTLNEKKSLLAKKDVYAVAPGPLGCVMIGNKIYMGINKDPKSRDYATISDKIQERLRQIFRKHPHEVELIHNQIYWDGPKHVPFKRDNKGEMACNNGSTCIEPVLFNYLLSRGILTEENIRTKQGYSYTCLWVGNPETESEYIIGTKSTGFHERMYERLFTEHYLRNYDDDRDILIANYHIVFNLMLACPGCQMNYNQIINQDVSIQWDDKGCNKSIALKIDTSEPVLETVNFDSDSDEPFLRFRSKKKSVQKSPSRTKKSPRKSKKSAPRRKSISKKKSAPRRKSVRKMSPKSKTSRRKSRS